MKWVHVVWTEQNEKHLLSNNVRREEAEFVIHNPVGSDVSRTSGRPIAFGYTAARRKIAVVYEVIDKITVYPITVYDVE